MKNKAISIIVTSVALLLIWHGASVALDKAFLPTPWQSFEAFVTLCKEGKMWPNFQISAMRVFLSTVLGVVLAVPLGLTCGRNNTLYHVSNPLVAIIYPLPKVVFLPILVVLFGLGNLPKIILITLIIFFQIFVVVCDASHQLPQESVDAMYTLSKNKWAIFRHLLMPACLPAMLTSLRISVGTSVAVLFFSETFASFDGLGYLILDGMGCRDYPNMFAGIIGMALLGVLFYECIYFIEKRCCRWL